MCVDPRLVFSIIRVNPYLRRSRLQLLYWNDFRIVMETSSRHDEHDPNDNIMFTEGSITETEKEQLLGLLPSPDSPLREKQSRTSRLCYIIVLLFLSNIALLAGLLVSRRSNEVMPQKPWLPPESS